MAQLQAKLHTQAPGVVVVSAQYLHYIEATGLGSAERHKLEHLLDYGPPLAAGNGNTRIWVSPRLGTISPWSSKATEIAWVCGLSCVKRIERAVLYRLETATDRTGIAAHELGNFYDPMTESVHDGEFEPSLLFHSASPAAVTEVHLEQLETANIALGLALSPAELAFLASKYAGLGRCPTDAELMMFAQVNSEHCRHKVFNAAWELDGTGLEHSLFDMIRNTFACSPGRVASAYHDNAAVLSGAASQRLLASPHDHRYGLRLEPSYVPIKVETHNHPTAISPYPGAATGSGGEIRDEAATGRGAVPKAGLCGFTVSHLRIPGAERPWEAAPMRPERIASPFRIMLEAPVGAAAFNNEFGRPNIAGYFRSFEQACATSWRWGYHKPIMIAGGLGAIRPQHVTKQTLVPGCPIVVLGGPAMLIGLGGGAASSMSSGSGDAELDFASVQRDNAEMQRRCQEVITRCTAMGNDNPIVSVHDVGAGGLSNAVPELVHAAGLGGEFELREIPSAEPQLSPRELWCNEAQERFVLAVDPMQMESFVRLCERERCPYAVIGEAKAQPQLRVKDRHFENAPVDMAMALLFGQSPRLQLTASTPPDQVLQQGRPDVEFIAAVARVLRLPSVASKSFLITIGDRSVGGLVARDQMVGPWQVPVADCAITLADYSGYAGEAMALGERTPLAVDCAAAAARMAVGEALTNIAAAPISQLADIALSANWMAAVDAAHQPAELYQAVQAVGMRLCPELGLSIPVGKDSLSMRTRWHDSDAERQVVSPVSLIVSAFAITTDARAAVTPQLDVERDSALWFIDLACGRQRLGGSALAQVFNWTNMEVPDFEQVDLFKRWFAGHQALIRAGLVAAYHDRSDGGLFVTLCEMAFAGHCGFEVDVDPLGTDHIAALFNEELGVVLQVARADTAAFTSMLAKFHIDAILLGTVTQHPSIVLRAGDDVIYRATRAELQQIWAETSFLIAQQRDNPQCAEQELAHILDDADPGLNPQVNFDLKLAPPLTYSSMTKPRVAILREQGVNGHHEMAAAFMHAGFEAIDVHMTDIIDRHYDLTQFQGLVACGGFSYGDVLGGGGGWAKSILFNPRAREVFTEFFNHPGKFSLGVCNGCQMLAQLTELIPGAAHWPRFERNFSEQFESRLSLVRIQASNSIFLKDMQGSRLMVAIAHGEGRAEFNCPDQQATAAMQYVDNHGYATMQYPQNPNGSTNAVAGLCNDDGRITIMMPHPERVFRNVQLSWRPKSWQHDLSPWFKIFLNARAWLA